MMHLYLEVRLCLEKLLDVLILVVMDDALVLVGIDAV